MIFVVYIPKNMVLLNGMGRPAHGFHGVSRRSAALQGNPRSEGVKASEGLCSPTVGPRKTTPPKKTFLLKKSMGFTHDFVVRDYGSGGVVLLHQLNNLRPRPLKITYSIENADEDEEVGEFIQDF